MLYLSFICNFRLVGGSVVHFQLVANWHCLVVRQLIQYSVTRAKRHRTSLFPILLSLLLIVWSNPPYCHHPTNKTSWPPWTGHKTFFERCFTTSTLRSFHKKNHTKVSCNHLQEQLRNKPQQHNSRTKLTYGFKIDLLCNETEFFRIPEIDETVAPRQKYQFFLSPLKFLLTIEMLPCIIFIYFSSLVLNNHWCLHWSLWKFK